METINETKKELEFFTKENVKAYSIRPNSIECFQIEAIFTHPNKDRSALVKSSMGVMGNVTIPASLVRGREALLEHEFSMKVRWMNRLLSTAINRKNYIRDGKKIELPQDVSIDDFKMVSLPENRVFEQFKDFEIENIDISDLIDSEKGLEIYNRKTANTVFEYCQAEDGKNLYLIHDEFMHRFYDSTMKKKAVLVRFCSFRTKREEEGKPILALLFNWLVKNDFIDHATMVCGRIGEGEGWRYLLFVCAKEDCFSSDVNSKLGFPIQYDEGVQPRFLELSTLKIYLDLVP